MSSLCNTPFDYFFWNTYSLIAHAHPLKSKSYPWEDPVLDYIYWKRWSSVNSVRLAGKFSCQWVHSGSQDIKTCSFHTDSWIYSNTSSCCPTPCFVCHVFVWLLTTARTRKECWSIFLTSNFKMRSFLHTDHFFFFEVLCIIFSMCPHLNTQKNLLLALHSLMDEMFLCVGLFAPRIIWNMIQISSAPRGIWDHCWKVFWRFKVWLLWTLIYYLKPQSGSSLPDCSSTDWMTDTAGCLVVKKKKNYSRAEAWVSNLELI